MRVPSPFQMCGSRVDPQSFNNFSIVSQYLGDFCRRLTTSTEAPFAFSFKSRTERHGPRTYKEQRGDAVWNKLSTLSFQ